MCARPDTLKVNTESKTPRCATPDTWATAVCTVSSGVANVAVTSTPKAEETSAWKASAIEPAETLSANAWAELMSANATEYCTVKVTSCIRRPPPRRLSLHIRGPSVALESSPRTSMNTTHMLPSTARFEESHRRFFSLTVPSSVRIPVTVAAGGTEVEAGATEVAVRGIEVATGATVVESSPPEVVGRSRQNSMQKSGGRLPSPSGLASSP
mmetsp:Transcript_40117/g.106421  ORF Transcript_40117/g.106421 Transcript_40117/m.106421 type:complete len:212 (+) Transcript_40117:44-679(+)